jgi:hypothetical protein
MTATKTRFSGTALKSTSQIRRAIQAALDGWTPKSGYLPCDHADIPANVRFDVSRRTAGNMQQSAYGGFDRAEHGYGDLFLRESDSSDGSVEYYRWHALDPTKVAVSVSARIGREPSSWEADIDGKIRLYVGGITAMTDDTLTSDVGEFMAEWDAQFTA